MPEKRDTALLQHLRPSRYLHRFERDGVVALYHSLTTALVFLDQHASSVYDQLMADGIPHLAHPSGGDLGLAEQDVVSQLRNAGLLVTPNDSEEDYLRKLQSDNDVAIRLMYILPTDRCNLQCKYCFLEQAFPEDHHFSVMTPEILLRGIDYFFSLSSAIGDDDRRRILFYGGEPTLCEDVLVQGFEYIKKNAPDDKLDVLLITNGTHITECIARAIKAFDIKVSISLDGPRRVNDQARVTSTGSGSFVDATAGIRALQEAGVDGIGASVTVGMHNAGGLRDHVRYLIEHFGFTSIGFNLLTDLPGKKNPVSVDVREASEAIFSAFEYLRSIGIYEDRMVRKLRPFADQKVLLKDCGAIGDQIVLTPTGAVGPCHAFLDSKDYFIADALSRNIDIRDSATFREWARRKPVNIPSCHGCPAIAVCGGGCPYQAYLSSGSIWEMDERMCLHNKLFLEWAIWDAYSKIES